MPKIEEAFFLKIPHFQVPREIEIQDNFKAIERWANTLTLPDTNVPTVAVNGGLTEIPASPPTPVTWKVNVDETTITIVGNILRLKPNGVTLAAMADASVGTLELIDGSVTSAKIGPGQVGSSQIATGAIDATKIGNGQVGSSALASNAVSSASIADGSILSADIGISQIISTLIASNAVTFAKIGTDWPRFFCSKNLQFVSNGTPITFTGESYDVGNWHSSGSSSFFVPDTGSYIFTGYIEYGLDLASGPAGAEIVVNGLRIGTSFGIPDWSSNHAWQVTVARYCNAGEQIQLRAINGTGGSRPVATALLSGAAISN